MTTEQKIIRALLELAKQLDVSQAYKMMG
jgi:hypothetical protein